MKLYKVQSLFTVDVMSCWLCREFGRKGWTISLNIRCTVKPAGHLANTFQCQPDTLNFPNVFCIMT
jgi:hypothetical protein